ncbi:MAG: hypothetical protein LBL97_02155 [Prevotellaceae bacterium]|jgi:hypothetical protein|nr:hypothetical protein [Prevotellaceae bacterium]
MEDSHMDGFWMEWRAFGLLNGLMILPVLSIIYYFAALLSLFGLMYNPELISYIIGVCLVIWLLFIFIAGQKVLMNRNRWKNIIKEFDRLPQKENTQMGLIALGIVLFVILSLILSICLMAKTSPVRNGP